jgi:hypothetical protein
LRDCTRIPKLRLRLKRRTSINSIFQTHKEKEMADFRKLFYALALVAMLAGLTIPASAQAPPFQCIANAGVPPIVRGEGYAELVGDLTLNCTGGIPTLTGQTVPPVNFTILLNTNITSKLTAALGAGGWDEALLIIDEPHSAVNVARPILNCGATGAPDNGASGPGVCSITSVGNPAITYDGTPGSTYGAGHPNVFQGRTGTLQNPGQYNAVTWNGVPLDPPGTTTGRTLRFTNIRADAVFLGVSSTFTTNYIQAQISVNGNTSLSINNPQQIVAYVQKGLITTTSTINASGTAPLVGGTPITFLQCNSQNNTAVTLGTGGVIGSTPALGGGFNYNFPGSPIIKFTEGFASSFKAKNIAHIINQSGNVGNGKLPAGVAYWVYNGNGTGTNTYNYPTDLNQNVPGAIYNTESGFENGSTAADPNPNPPAGVGNTPVSSVGIPFASAVYTATNTGIANAGIATQGTRLAVQITSIPNGVTIFVPTAITLTNNAAGTNVTGIAVLTTTAADGSGAYTPASTSPSPATYLPISGGLAVYEVLFADPFSVEAASVPIIAGWVTNLSSNLPQPGVTAQAAGGFAPFYSTAAAHNPSSTLPVPRFVPGLVPVNIFSMVKCACDILFPWVVSTGGFDTGIALANTSLDPGAAFGFGASPQSGAVQLWYYGTGSNGTGAPPATQCTNTTTPGTCPGTTTVPAGQVLTYVVSQGSTQWGLDNRGAGFAGYVIAQSAFQYCHAFAYISALGAGPLTTGISEGYLGLILDPGGLSRTGQTSENLVH